MARELMITNISVVDDPLRTRFDGPAGDLRVGAWTFKRLVEDMAPTPAQAPAMAEAMLESFTRDQTINGFVVAARPGMKEMILDPWPRTADGALDLRAAPLRLLAIVNRFDLRNLDHGDAGEARFVFGFIGEDGIPLAATLSLEYKLPASSEADVLEWARAFHALGALPFSEEYNAALQAVTDSFAGRGAGSGPNGSAIHTVRTDEIALGDIWELREFVLSPATGMLVPTPLDLTPNIAFNGSTVLASFINANAPSIIAETHTVPDSFEGQPFRAGAVPNDLEPWLAPGILDNEARHHFSLNTCNGCHSAETGTAFLHVRPRLEGHASFLSRFLTGDTVSDPVTDQPRTFNDLARRVADLDAVVCPIDGALAPTVNLRKGIQRVH